MARTDLDTQSPRKNASLAALLSLFVPGLGQIYLGHRERGRLIVLATAVLLALLWWLEMWYLLPLILPFWLYNAWEARQLGKGERGNTAMLVVLAALLTYAIGWQVTEINVGRFIEGIPKIQPFVTGLVQPAYLDREIEYARARISLEVPCSENPPPLTAASGSPSITIDRACANPGDSIVITGQGFPANVEGELWWENTIGDQSRLRKSGDFLDFQTDDQGDFLVEAVIPQVTNTVPQINYIEARYVVKEGSLAISHTTTLVVQRMGETIAQALMATTLGAIIAVFFSFFAARNLMQFHPLAIVIYYAVRGVLNILRAIEPLIMAIVFVVWVGLGPFAGVLALTVHSIAALGKLYSESIESIEPGPIEAITATGANRIQVVWYAVLPQVWPPFIAFTVYRWDINVRMSTIIGFVGGGGIGFLLQQWIRLTDFRSAGAAIWAIAVVVTVLDFFSREVRKRVV
jgi:phosphonate transport system permease protein